MYLPSGCTRLRMWLCLHLRVGSTCGFYYLVVVAMVVAADVAADVAVCLANPVAVHVAWQVALPVAVSNL